MNVNHVKKKLEEQFKDDAGLIIKDIFVESNNYVCTYAFINGLASPSVIGELVIKPILAYPNSLYKTVLLTANITTLTDIDEVILELLKGNCVIFDSKLNDFLIVDTKQNLFRSIAEPSNEVVMTGPHDGFIENILINTGLIRRHVNHKNFKLKYMSLVGDTKSTLAIMYIEGIAKQENINLLNDRIDKIKSLSTIDINFLRENIKDHKYSPFKTIGSTERPDVVASKLLQGKIALIMDGSPVCLWMPYTLKESFENPEDNYDNFYISSFNRIIRIISFMISLTLPAFYVGILCFHQELIPPKLLLSIKASRLGVPFPTAFETIFLIIVFELLRETGSKIPQTLGIALSVVGAIIIGQAAAEAKIVSLSVVIVVAISSVSGLMNVKSAGALLIFKLILVILASFLGIHGVIFGIIIILVHLLNMNSLNDDYVKGLFSFSKKQATRAYLRLPKKVNK